MAISAGAAIVGGGLIAGEAITAVTLMYVGLAATAVGMVTGNSTLSKIGGGLSLAGGIGTLAGGAGQTAAAEAGAQSTATEGATADTALSQSTAPGNMAPVAAEGAAPAADALSATEAATAPTASSLQSPAQSMLNEGGLINDAVNEGMTLTPASGEMNAASTSMPGAEGSGTDALGQSAPPASAPGSQSPITQVPPEAYGPATPSTPSVQIPEAQKFSGGMYEAAGISQPGAPEWGASEAGKAYGAKASYMQAANDALSFVKEGGPGGAQSALAKWWAGLDSSAKLAVGQTASGLVSGMGKGVFEYGASKEKNALTQQQIDLQRQQQARQQANLSGRAPAVNMAFNPNAQLYPAGGYVPPGLINRARV